MAMAPVTPAASTQAGWSSRGSQVSTQDGSSSSASPRLVSTIRTPQPVVNACRTISLSSSAEP